MLNKLDLLDNIKTRLGYPVIDLAITDEMIYKQIDCAIKKIVPYLSNLEVITTYEKVTKFDHGRIFSVIRVSSASNYSGVLVTSESIDDTNSSTGVIVPGSSETTSQYVDCNINLEKAINYGMYVVNSNRKLVDYALWNYFCDSVQEDLNPIGFRLIGDTLYIDGGNSPWTIEAVTNRSIATMTTDCQNWVLDYATALTKCIEGEIRSKVKITGMPVETNGSEIKSEGITEKKELEEKLGTVIGLFYATR